MGKKKLLQMTEEEQQFKRYLDSKCSGGEQRQLMSSYSVNDLKDSVSSDMFNPNINKRSKLMQRKESVD